MADFILHAALSNLLVSALLAVVAWIIQQRYQSATLANFLWVMVLLKMVTPPLFALPLLEVTSIAGHNSSSALAARMSLFTWIQRHGRQNVVIYVGPAPWPPECRYLRRSCAQAARMSLFT